MHNNTNKQILLPIWLAFAIASGIIIGAQFVDKPIQTKNTGSSVEKLREVLLSIDNNYVDSVSMDFLVEEGIKGILKELDPHTRYIPNDEISRVHAQLNGSYDGIGIEFDVLNDTITVVKPIKGGPSDKEGLKIGDRIISVNGETVVGIKISSKGVTTRLLGDKGSEVDLIIYRPRQKEKIAFKVKRGSINQSTVDGFYMVDKNTGYIKLSRFGTSSATEVKSALTELIDNGMSQLILDLQGNPGGYLVEAEKIADEFIKENKVIVSQKGKTGKFNNEFKSTDKGIFESSQVIILIDEYSASASEILAGALQDNDRALIVGRRSFGKGLVQLPIPLSDGSELRLTIARYYTPSGRSIQKSYKNGNKEYAHDISERFSNGEFYNEDSIHFPDSLKYKTIGGRTVYGGGGIMPDYFVPLDSARGRLYRTLLRKGLLRSWVLRYYVNNLESLEETILEDFVRSFVWDPIKEKSLLSLSREMNISIEDDAYLLSKNQISLYCKAEIARLRWGENEYYQLVNPITNQAFQKSLTLFGETILPAY